MKLKQTNTNIDYDLKAGLLVAYVVIAVITRCGVCTYHRPTYHRGPSKLHVT